MKNMKYICLLLLCSFILGMVSCTDEEEGTRSKNIDGLQLQLCIAKSNIVSPVTKSADGEGEANKINNLNILIYSKENEEYPIYANYYTTVDEMKGLSVDNNSKQNAVEYNIHLSDGTYEIRAIANADEDMRSFSLSQVDEKRYDLQNGKPKFVMYASAEVTLEKGKGSAELALTRIYSKITVQVEASDLSPDVEVKPQSISYYNIPSTGGFSKNLIDKENVVAAIEKFQIDDNLSKSHEEAIPFYMYENSQPTGLYSTQNQIDSNFPGTKKPPVGYDKTPYYFSNPISISDIISSDKQSSYIEVIADYKNKGIKGTIKYRFFLGKNHYDDFNVERNTHYKITLSLSGTGGKDEVSWRVETDLVHEINVSDIYIGYLDQSSGYITVTTKDGSLLKNLTITPEKSNDIAVQPASGSEKTRTFKATAHNTNLMQDAYNIGIFTVIANFEDGSSVSKPVRVHQVSRLVDPIAFYRKADNANEEEIKVLEYKRGDSDYHILTSDGPWTATIEKGNWFIINNDAGKATSQSESIGGDGGEIRFTYQPKGTALENRYGVILVKYHNNNCEHRIYLRQGYDPTAMPGANAAWSMFNCYGNGDKDKKMVDYPTQTGYFYQAGSNNSYHPFRPGFEESYSEYPTNRNNKYKGTNGILSWMNNSNTPCPTGYRLPSADEISNVANQNLLLQGFVHDDDPIAGWSRVSAQIDLKDNVNCNPAKGTLIVDSETGKSIFFSYGKGVLTSHYYSYKNQSKPFDIDLNEIGVGARGMNGELRYQLGDMGADRYGALYYTSSEATGEYSTSHHTLKAMDFWYDMTSPSKNGNVIFNPPSTIVSHGAFVRCVKDEHSGGGENNKPDGSEDMVKILATFYYSDEEGSSHLLDNVSIDVQQKSGSKIGSFWVIKGKAREALNVSDIVEGDLFLFCNGKFAVVSIDNLLDSQNSIYFK